MKFKELYTAFYESEHDSMVEYLLDQYNNEDDSLILEQICYNLGIHPDIVCLYNSYGDIPNDHLDLMDSMGHFEFLTMIHRGLVNLISGLYPYFRFEFKDSYIHLPLSKSNTEVVPEPCPSPVHGPTEECFLIGEVSRKHPLLACAILHLSSPTLGSLSNAIRRFRDGVNINEEWNFPKGHMTYSLAVNYAVFYGKTYYNNEEYLTFPCDQ